jgi:hypothetical protein
MEQRAFVPHLCSQRNHLLVCEGGLAGRTITLVSQAAMSLIKWDPNSEFKWGLKWDLKIIVLILF